MIYPTQVAVVNETGDILCLVDRQFIFLPLQEVTLDNIFIFWDRDLKELRNCLFNIHSWRKDSKVEEFDLDLYSILDISIDEETGEFWFE